LDYQSTLIKINAKIKQMKRCWLLHTVDCHTTTTSSSIMNPSAIFFEISEEAITDPSLFAAVQTLNNFLIHFPQPIDSPNTITCYQPSHEQQLLL